MRRLLSLIAFASTFAAGAAAREFTVADGPGLARALAAAQAGDRIVLGAGDYGDLVLRGRRFAAPVEIAAAPGARAAFGSVLLEDAAGLSFRDVVVAGGAVADPKRSATTRIVRASDIAFENVAFHGAIDGRPDGDPNAIVARDCRGLKVSNARFHDLWRGAAIFDCSDWSVTESEFRRMASDGIVARGAVAARIEGNLFTDFATDLASGVHPDAIQIWDKLARRATRDVVVRRNAIVRGEGGPAQGIFLFGADPELTAQNLLIEDNLVIQSMGIGIGLRNVAGALVRRNTVAPADPLGDRPGIDVRAPASGVVIDGNAALGLRPGPARTRGHVALDFANPHADGYVERVFADPRSGAGAGFAPLAAAGARDFAPKFFSAPAAAIHSKAEPHDPQRFVFEVKGRAAPAAWRVKAPGAPAFGPPTIARGFHAAFDAPGLAVVEANWREAGVLKTARKTVRVFPRVVFAGAFDAVEKGEGGFATIEPGAGATGMAVLTISVEAAPARGSAALETLVAAPGAYQLRLSAKEVFAALIGADGVETRLGALLPAPGTAGLRNLRLVYDGVTGRATLSVDGAVVASEEFAPGALLYRKNAALFIGGAPWAPAFSGKIGRVEILRTLSTGEAD